MNVMYTSLEMLVSLLIAGDYGVVARVTRNDRLSELELEAASTQHGRTLAPIPYEELMRSDVSAIRDREYPTFHVVIDLWTLEEGRSDLSLELELIDRYGGAYEIRILDLHVL